MDCLNKDDEVIEYRLAVRSTYIFRVIWIFLLFFVVVVCITLIIMKQGSGVIDKKVKLFFKLYSFKMFITCLNFNNFIVRSAKIN